MLPLQDFIAERYPSSNLQIFVAETLVWQLKATFSLCVSSVLVTILFVPISKQALVRYAVEHGTIERNGFSNINLYKEIQ
jgi:hypothetical protein